MGELQAGCVQHVARDASGSYLVSVLFISHYRMPDALQVAADLMFASGFQFDAEVAVDFSFAQDFYMADRLLVVDWSVEGELPIGNGSMHQGFVELFHFACFVGLDDARE